MKRALALVLVLVIVLSFAACANNEDTESVENTSEPTSSSSFERTTTATATTTTEQYYYEEETQRYYNHSAIQGCVIVDQDGTEEVHYREKCEACGYVSSSTHTMWHSLGGFTSSFMCPQCGNMQKVEFETNEY